MDEKDIYENTYGCRECKGIKYSCKEYLAFNYSDYCVFYKMLEFYNKGEEMSELETKIMKNREMSKLEKEINEGCGD